MTRSRSTALLMILSSALLCACAVSEPSPPSNGQSISDVTVSQAQQDERLLIDIKTSDSSDSEKIMGASAVVRWGGTIASLNNLADGRTVIELVSRPLQSGGRPIHNDRSDGRFLAEIDEFLDPEILTVGRDLTVIGPLVRRQTGTVGEAPYVYPVVMVRDLRFWKELIALPPQHFPHWNHSSRRKNSDRYWYDWPFLVPRPVTPASTR